ncbi:MAG: FimB/Mfa2 family fimbrial subunit [Muribaculaceae bacterium]|nr:FimB/Mfa2 family fimbrial subunit [Muribaculaceae bacterium]
MKLKNLILPAITVVMLSSCSMFHDELEPCRQKANIRLSYTKNVEGTDKFNEQVHCAKVLLYDGSGTYMGQYDYDAAAGGISVSLPAGNYHAVAYGGMGCDEADFLFADPLSEGHKYSSLMTYLNGTRAGESSKDLHDHFHSTGDFTVAGLDTGEVSTVLDLTKNTNRFRVELMYEDGSAITANDFICTITADNAVTDYANNVVAQGEDVVYRAHTTGIGTAETGEGDVPMAWSAFTTGRLTADSNITLHVDRTAWPDKTLDLPLIEYLKEVYKHEMTTGTLQDYLDRQDTWNVSVTVQPDHGRVVVVTLKINDWKLVISGFDC